MVRNLGEGSDSFAAIMRSIIIDRPALRRPRHRSLLQTGDCAGTACPAFVLDRPAAHR